MHGSKSEMALRRALHAEGLRFYVHYRKVPGSPDIAFPRQGLAVFIDGELWHGHRSPVPNASSKKIWNSALRDSRVENQLAELGWRVLRIRERDIRRDLDGCVETVTRSLNE